MLINFLTSINRCSSRKITVNVFSWRLRLLAALCDGLGGLNMNNTTSNCLHELLQSLWVAKSSTEVLAAHLSCSRCPSSHPGTPGHLKARSDSGQSSRHEEHTAYCTCCYSSCHHTAPGCDRWGEPPARRAGWSARGHRGWSYQCERCVRSAAPPRLKQKTRWRQISYVMLWIFCSDLTTEPSGLKYPLLRLWTTSTLKRVTLRKSGRPPLSKLIRKWNKSGPGWVSILA